MPELSDSSRSEGTTAVLANGPESRFVVDAIEAMSEGDAARAQQALADGARATSLGALAHRLDVAGRALVADLLAEGLHIVDVVRELDTTTAPVSARRFLGAWARGGGMDVSIDLVADRVELLDDDETVLDALVVVAWLVERSGFPAQVVV